MPSAPDLAAFLRARYLERRELALAATPGPWTAEIHQHRRTKQPVAFEVHPVAELEGNGDGGILTAADAQHIATHGPDDVLADLDAKLAVITIYENAARSLTNAEPGTPPYDLVTGATNTMRFALRRLAVPFASHPDYDEKWAL